MRLSFKSINKKTLFLGVAAIFAGSFATTIAFAAIPHSSTGMIAACRNNITGALRAIDAQAGATCGIGSTPLSWPTTNTGDGDSTHSALLRLEANPEDATNYVMDSARSRNMVDVKTVNDPNPENVGFRYLCIKAAFTPEVKVISPLEQVGGGLALDVKIPNQGLGAQEAINFICGSDYNAIVFLHPGSGNANPQSIFFSN